MGFFQKMDIVTAEDKERTAEQWKKKVSTAKAAFFTMGLLSGAAFIILIVAYAFFQ